MSRPVREASPMICGRGVGCGTLRRTMTLRPLLPFVLGIVACAPSYTQDDVLTLAHAQVKGTHNSYHQVVGPTLPPWRASQAPLDVQLESQGVRALELDVHLLPDDPRLQVFHVAQYDELSSCRLFTECLRTIERWSSAHPGHMPLAVQVEVKGGYAPENADTFLTTVESEILEVFERSRILTPDEVKGAHVTLREAVRAGWPTLERTRGRLYFFFDNGEAVVDPYTHGRKSLDGRLLFVKSTPDDPWGAVAILNNPLTQKEDIARALAAGFIVRTRADSDSEEPLEGDDTRMKAALASGAQIVSTDYPVLDPELDYEVVIPGGAPARCNPVTAPAKCENTHLEHPELLSAP